MRNRNIKPQQRRPVAERSSFLLHTEEVSYMAASFKVSLLSSDSARPFRNSILKYAIVYSLQILPLLSFTTNPQFAALNFGCSELIGTYIQGDSGGLRENL
jgi:hypothetical protein